MDCTITDMTLAGLEQDGVFYVTDIIIEYECSGSGTNDGDDDPDPGLDNGGGEFPQDEGPQGGGGGGNGEQIPTIIEDELVFDNISNNLTNPCASNIFNELREGNYKNDIIKPEIQVPNELMTLNFSEVVYKMFNDLEYINYEIQNGPLTDKNGLTKIYSGNIVTTISDTFIENGTKLAMARTMIHEAVHAYIVYKDNSLDTEFRNAIKQYGKQNGYDIDDDPNRFHHEFMGQYVNAMAFSLYEWDKENGSGGNLGWDYYYAMAFGGLYYKDSNDNMIETDSFKALVPDLNKRLEIKNILINEQDGNSKAKSSKC